jgi:hypothetical protein
MEHTETTNSFARTTVYWADLFIHPVIFYPYYILHSCVIQGFAIVICVMFVNFISFETFIATEWNEVLLGD